MKKIVLSLLLICTFVIAKSQGVVLNEIYGNPNGANSEFIELYNSSAPESLDCYTLITYFEDEGGTNKGWYVLDFPNTASIGALPGFFVSGPASTISVQGTPNVSVNLNWNDATFRSGATNGYLRKYIQNGGTNATATYIQDPSFTNATSVANFSDGTLNGGQFYFALLYRNGVLVNGFVGGGSSGILSSYAIPLGTLNITPANAGCSGTFNAFGNLTTVEFFNPSGGSDNGYARICDGRCGSWDKTSNQVNHTPGASSPGSSTNCTVANPMATQQFLSSCAGSNGDNIRFVQFDITGLGTGGATEADDFPVLVTAYADINKNNALDGGDIVINSTPKVQSTVASSADTIRLGDYRNYGVILVYRTKRGCFDKVVAVPNTCQPLPVEFKSFTAVRNRSNVMLRWETASEQNNSGFAIERNVNGNWEQIGWVPTQAQNGYSESVLVYSYNDLNNIKGISQYRIRQVDFDAKSKLSETRAVRGDGQIGKTIVYPNPSNNGKINVVFEDASVTREVSVSDMSGRVIRQMKGITNNNITIENLNPGMYTIRIVAIETGEQAVEKVVVNKR